MFTQVIASAKDDKAKQVFPREWDLAYIALPMVCQREQHRPTLEPEEVESILSKCKRSTYRMVAGLLAGTGIRISELLALEIGKHIFADCSIISIRQQRGKWGGIESTPKTDAGFRDIHLCPHLAKMRIMPPYRPRCRSLPHGCRQRESGVPSPAAGSRPPRRCRFRGVMRERFAIERIIC